MKTLIAVTVAVLMTVSLSIAPAHAIFGLDPVVPPVAQPPGCNCVTAAGGGHSALAGLLMALPFILLAEHDLLYSGWSGIFTPNAAYGKYVDNLNNAWKTQKHYDRNGVEYTPKDTYDKDGKVIWDNAPQEAYYKNAVR